METISEQALQDMLQSIKPWFDRDQAFIFDLARTDWNARFAIAAALMESGKEKEAAVLLQSIAAAEPSEDQEQEGARIRACMELAHLLMEELKYDQAENLLWQARNAYSGMEGMEFLREDISLLIAQCRFGQGFIQEAVDRATEILHKLESMNAEQERFAKTHQLLGWFLLHKTDVPEALAHTKKAMALASGLDRELVEAGLEAEKNNDYEKAIGYYFDAIQYEG